MDQYKAHRSIHLMCLRILTNIVSIIFRYDRLKVREGEIELDEGEAIGLMLDIITRYDENLKNHQHELVNNNVTKNFSNSGQLSNDRLLDEMQISVNA